MFACNTRSRLTEQHRSEYEVRPNQTAVLRGDMKASSGLCCSLLLAASVVVAPATSRGAPAPAPDPKGEQDRRYEFPGTGEKIAYHLYVPMKWTPSTKLPLVIVTHGANQPATAPFQRPMANPTLAKMAEERGYIVAAVTGYHANATVVG